MKEICMSTDPQDATDLEIMEYSLGGYRFGVQRHCVVDSDNWYANYLRPLHCEDQVVLGTMLYRGEPIFTVDLRQLFFFDQELITSAAPFYTVIKYEETLFTILHDGFLGTTEAPLKRFKFFKSLYVLGIKWLSGVILFDEYLVIMLNLEALSNMFTKVENQRQQEISSPFTSALLLE
jgi:chemotaxis signal transduction protein